MEERQGKPESGSDPLAAGRADGREPILSQEAIERLIEELGDDEELVREALALFAEQLPQRIAYIEALDVGTVGDETWRRTIHALGSPAAMLGMLPLNRKCREAERAPRDQWASDKAQVLTLADQCGRELRAYLGS